MKRIVFFAKTPLYSKILATSTQIEYSEARSKLTMFRRNRFLTFPTVIGAVLIGVVSGKAIFGPPLEGYWRKKLEEEAAAKENGGTST